MKSFLDNDVTLSITLQECMVTKNNELDIGYPQLTGPYYFHILGGTSYDKLH